VFRRRWRWGTSTSATRPEVNGVISGPTPSGVPDSSGVHAGRDFSENPPPLSVAGCRRRNSTTAEAPGHSPPRRRPPCRSRADQRPAHRCAWPAARGSEQHAGPRGHGRGAPAGKALAAEATASPTTRPRRVPVSRSTSPVAVSMIVAVAASPRPAHVLPSRSVRDFFGVRHLLASSFTGAERVGPMMPRPSLSLGLDRLHRRGHPERVPLHGLKTPRSAPRFAFLLQHPCGQRRACRPGRGGRQVERRHIRPLPADLATR